MAETPQDRSLAAGLEQHRSPGTAMVTGLFRDRASAERAWEAASRRGYEREHVNVVMSDATRKRHFSGDDAVQTELGSKAAEGAGIGAGIGGTLGAIAGVVAAVGTSIALPGLGLVIAGPLAAGLAGAGAGGVTGGLLGALIGAGIPEERVKHYEQGIHEGGILMGVAPRSEEDARELERSWRVSNGEHVLGTGAVIGADAPANPVAEAPSASAPGMAAHYGEEEAYWRRAFDGEPYRLSEYRYEDYAPAYHLGYTTFGRYGTRFEEAESRLASEWDVARGASRLSWQQALPAVRAAWDKIGGRRA